jgi:hypothetical protein
VFAGWDNQLLAPDSVVIEQIRMAHKDLTSAKKAAYWRRKE